MIQLTDDGTLDTVLRCSECDKEFRYNYAHTFDMVDEEEVPTYNQYVDDIIEGVTAGHVCKDSDNDDI